MSEEQFVAWCDEDVKAEWIDGEVIVTSLLCCTLIGTTFMLSGWRHRRGTRIGRAERVRSFKPGLAIAILLVCAMPLLVGSSRAEDIKPKPPTPAESGDLKWGTVFQSTVEQPGDLLTRPRETVWSGKKIMADGEPRLK